MRVIRPEDTSTFPICLECLPFFDTFSQEEKQELLNHGIDLIRYETGEFLIQEGSTDQALYFLLSGSASVVKEGASIPIAELTPGELFGEMAFLTGFKRTSNVIVHPFSATRGDTATSVLSEKLCAQLCPDDPGTTIVLRIDCSILNHLQRETRIRIKDQIIGVLTVRMEKISLLIEEALGRSPHFPKTPTFQYLLDQEGESNREEIKDQIIQHLVSLIIQLNQTLSEAG